MATHCHTTPALPRERLAELHDDIALALDAIGSTNPANHQLPEARSYLRRALRVIGGVA